MTFINKLVSLIVVSALWAVCSIPIFTAGASTAALYYTVQKCIKNGRGTVGSVFWQGLKENFKQSTIIMLIFLVVDAVFAADIYVVNLLTEAGALQGYMTWLFRILLVVLCIYAVWVFAYIARFEETVRMYLRNAAVFAILHLPVTIVVAILGFASVVLIYTFKPLVLILPGVTVWLMSNLMERVFRRYMTEEDKALEDERNMDYRNDYVGKRREQKKQERNSKGKNH
ncbi:MAG: YesL family protein [Clostridiales bacterium]|nr:YesL family protein [Clostridiales bacterium]